MIIYIAMLLLRGRCFYYDNQMLCRMLKSASLMHCTQAISLRVISWNLGSLQTNPFEFWQVPGSNVRSIQDKLDESLRRSTVVHVEDVVNVSMMNDVIETIPEILQRRIMLDVYDSLKGLSLHELITNPQIGEKRFVSFADRILRDHPTYGRRPSLISGYSGDISSIEVWWPEYMQFMRNVNPFDLLKEHDISKYGQSGLSPFELEHFKLLQLVHLILTDAAFVRIAENVLNWRSVVNDFNRLSDSRFERISEIIQSKRADVVCLQKVDAGALKPLKGYNAFLPTESNGKQDSVILLRTGRFESTERIIVDRNIASAGNLVLLKSVHVPTGQELVIGSYHGDANGRTTIKFLSSVVNIRNLPQTLIIGSDTNAHASEELTNKLSFTQLRNHAIYANWQLSNPDGHVTTRSCRTFLQAQSHKGHHVSDIHYQSDPKDQILIRDDLRIIASGVDFTGEGNDAAVPIPSPVFPSDHALVSANLDLGFSYSDPGILSGDELKFLLLLR